VYGRVAEAPLCPALRQGIFDVAGADVVGPGGCLGDEGGGLDDTDPPETTITRGPAARTSSRQARFRFSADEAGSRFSCRLDRGPWRACESPKRLRVGLGRHVFRVRARYAADNLDPTPALRRWRVVPRG
jgi:hypothetical protein